MAFSFSAASQKKLALLHPEPRRIVERAITISTVDFTPFEVLRTPERQAELVAQGFSKTLHSKHLLQPSGYSHAVDLVPYINGSLTWKDINAFKAIAEAMFKSQVALGIYLKWGLLFKDFDDWAHWQY
jgi:peptidoglycan L-alanyl-D-glutamate endopeptidase CwlK